MPHFLTKVSPQGLAVTAAVLLSEARAQALIAAGQPVPDPQQIVAILDTGASISAVHPSVLEALKLAPTGKEEIHTPSTQGVPHIANTYDVRIGIYAARQGDLPFVSDTVRVTASILSGGI
jgi:hypothetical protein